jgi:hypothetical protein
VPVAIREATDKDIKKYRVPIWIKRQEVLGCFNRLMVLVGQLDDDLIYT